MRKNIPIPPSPTTEPPTIPAIAPPESLCALGLNIILNRYLLFNYYSANGFWHKLYIPILTVAFYLSLGFLFVVIY